MARIDSYRDRMMAATRAARTDERALMGRIAKLYERAAEDMAEAAGRAAPGGLTEARAEALTKSLRARSNELWRGVQELTEAGMNQAAGRSVAVQTDFLREIGQSVGLDLKPTLARVFGSTADEAVAHVLRGGVYGGKAPALSKRIWNNEALQGGQIEQLIAQAVAKGQSAPQLAKALEAYVNPNIIQPDNWNDIYDIPFTYKVDYNAKRLAVTSIRHAAWGATITAARDNPFADYFHWELTPAHVIFDICDAHAAHDEGLGEGNFPVEAAPLPHPWCTCLYFIDTDKTLEEIGRELRGWLDGGENEQLDLAFAKWDERNRGSVTVIQNSYKTLKLYNYDSAEPVVAEEAIKDIVRSASEAVTQDFPILDQYLHAIGFENAEGVATAHLSIADDGRVGQVIALNQKLWHNEKAIRAFMETADGLGSHIDSKDPRAIIAHEYGHVILNTIALRNAMYTPGGTMLPAVRQIFRNIHQAVVDEAESYLLDGKTMEECQEEIIEALSSRAMEGREEFFAEALSQHYYGIKKSVFAQRAYNWAISKLR